MNMFARGNNFLTDRLLDQASVMIDYERGSDAVSLRAVVGVFTFRIADQYNMATYERSRDYIVSGKEFTDEFGEPQAGDIILENVHGIHQQYEVMAPSGEQPWRWADESQYALRIHTKYMGEVLSS